MTIFQKPNISLIIFIILSIFSGFVEGNLRKGLAVAAAVAGAIWCYGEIINGANWFRRLLGAGMLVAIIRGLYKIFIN